MVESWKKERRKGQIIHIGWTIKNWQQDSLKMIPSLGISQDHSFSFWYNIQRLKCSESPGGKYCCKFKLFRYLPEIVWMTLSQEQKRDFDSGSCFIVLGLLELEGKKKMSPLLRSICDITEIFNQYVSHDCDGAALTKKDLKNLLEREFGAVLRVRTNKKMRSIDLRLWDLFSEETRARTGGFIFILHHDRSTLHPPFISQSEGTNLALQSE